MPADAGAGAGGTGWRFVEQVADLSRAQAIYGSHVASDGLDAALYRVRKDGSEVELLVDGLEGSAGVAVDDEAVYFAHDAAISRLAK